jgi:REDY-like protein HapK
VRLFCFYNIRPEVSAAAWERFLTEHDIPFTLEFPSITGYRIYRNSGDPGGPMAFQYVEEIEVTGKAAFDSDTRSARWKEGMDAWYGAGGATWCFFYPEDVAATGDL